MYYTSQRNFKIWAYTISHCSLLLRSPLKYKDEDGYSEKNNHNIDIEFWGVDYMNVPTFFEKFAIKKLIKKEFPEQLKGTIDEKKSILFEIQSNQKKYYIVAAGCLIGRNKWYQEDRITNFNLNLEHDEVIAILKS